MKDKALNINFLLGNIFASVFEDEDKDFSKVNEKSYEKWDSLRGINLLLAVEKEFNIQITNDELLDFNSYSNIRKIIKNKLNE